MGYGKNNRRRTTSKVSRKGVNRSKFIKGSIPQIEELKAAWDPKATVYQNYKNLGLAANPNSFKNIAASASEEKKSLDDEPVVWSEIPESDVTRGSKRGIVISEDEQLYLRALMEKYGEDYKKMERDLKVNKKQWTEAKLRRRCTRLRLLDSQ